MSFNTLSDAYAFEGSLHVQSRLKNIGIGIKNTKDISNLRMGKKSLILS